MYIGSTYCDAAQWEYHSNVQDESYRKGARVAKANLASGQPEEQEARQTRKLIVYAVGQTLI